MVAASSNVEYLAELRRQVCSRCIVRRAGAPPCKSRGVGCGIEEHVSDLILICHAVDNPLIDPYSERLARDICAACPLQHDACCPCPLKYLLPLAVEAVEEVDSRRRRLATDWTGGT